MSRSRGLLGDLAELLLLTLGAALASALALAGTVLALGL